MDIYRFNLKSGHAFNGFYDVLLNGGGDFGNNKAVLNDYIDIYYEVAAVVGQLNMFFRFFWKASWASDRSDT